MTTTTFQRGDKTIEAHAGEHPCSVCGSHMTGPGECVCPPCHGWTEVPATDTIETLYDEVLRDEWNGLLNSGPLREWTSDLLRDAHDRMEDDLKTSPEDYPPILTLVDYAVECLGHYEPGWCGDVPAMDTAKEYTTDSALLRPLADYIEDHIHRDLWGNYLDLIMEMAEEAHAECGCRTA